MQLDGAQECAAAVKGDGETDQFARIGSLLAGLDPLFGHAVFVWVLDVTGGGCHVPVTGQTLDVPGVGQLEGA